MKFRKDTYIRYSALIDQLETKAHIMSFSSVSWTLFCFGHYSVLDTTLFRGRSFCLYEM